MKKFVSYDKLSKKARRERDAKQRTLWHISPVTRVTPSKTAYKRPSEKTKFRKEHHYEQE